MERDRPSFETIQLTALLRQGAAAVSLEYFRDPSRLDVNYIDPETGYSPLHYAVILGSRPLVRALAATGQCDFLQRDGQGRTAATIAVTVADDPVLGRYLYERQYAQEQIEGPRPYDPVKATSPQRPNSMAPSRQNTPPAAESSGHTPPTSPAAA